MATYTFIPPSVEESPLAWEPEFLQRYRLPRGISLYRDGSVFKTTRWVHEEHYTGKVDGRDYFKGGYIYTGVPQEIADQLIASGFGDGLSEET